MLFIRFFTDLARAMLSIPPQFNPSFCVQKILLKTTASPLLCSQCDEKHSEVLTCYCSFTWSQKVISSIMAKLEMAKNCHLHIWKFFCHLLWDIFCFLHWPVTTVVYTTSNDMAKAVILKEWFSERNFWILKSCKCAKEIANGNCLPYQVLPE